MDAFRDKVSWITGASSGIGREVAKQLSQQGAVVILSSRKSHDLEEVRKELAHPEKSHVLPLDLTSPDSFANLVEEVIAKYHRVDLLFLSGGISQRSYLIDTPLEVDRKIMEVNYFGNIALTKLVLPFMLRKGGGHIAVVSSLVGLFGYGVRSAYSASKHALHGFYESLSVELGEQNIHVSLICPGGVQTNISVNALTADGTPSGEMDEMQKAGLPVDKAVRQMLEGIKNQKRLIVIGNFREKFGVFIHRFFPSVFFKIASRQNPRGSVKL